ARCVGRETEFTQLADALSPALQGQGSARLVAGESGVGKSRLLEELRIWALVKGALVLRGQAVSEGGSHYHVWRDALRCLSILSDLHDDEASLLKPFVPDISDLLGRPIPDAPPLQTQAAQSRLFALVVELFRRQEQPVVVMLEDLQWAGSESLALLASLSEAANSLSVFVIGSYRDDEDFKLPQTLQAVPVLKLSRLSAMG